MKGAVSIAGFKKSGKTTLAVALESELIERGLQLAALKFSSHSFTMPGTDTEKFAEKCSIVAGISPTETIIHWPGLHDILQVLPFLYGDFLVVEGGKDLGLMPRVILLKDRDEADKLGLDLTLGTYGPIDLPGIPHFKSPVEVADAVLSGGFLLPGLDCGSCGRENCREVAAELVHTWRNQGQLPDMTKICPVLAAPTNININGKPLALNPFAEKIIRGGIIGMLAAMKGYHSGDLKIDMKDL